VDVCSQVMGEFMASDCSDGKPHWGAGATTVAVALRVLCGRRSVARRR
jgi:hypothetical protein